MSDFWDDVLEDWSTNVDTMENFVRLLDWDIKNKTEQWNSPFGKCVVGRYIEDDRNVLYFVGAGDEAGEPDSLEAEALQGKEWNEALEVFEGRVEAEKVWNEKTEWVHGLGWWEDGDRRDSLGEELEDSVDAVDVDVVA